MHKQPADRSPGLPLFWGRSTGQLSTRAKTVSSPPPPRAGGGGGPEQLLPPVHGDPLCLDPSLPPTPTWCLHVLSGEPARSAVVASTFWGQRRGQ